MGYQLLDDTGAPAKGTYTLLPDAPAPQVKPFGQQLNDSIADMPRQLGLTARYGIESAGNTFDTLIGNPLRTLAAPVFGNKPTADTGGSLADLVHLPKPQTAMERVVGDATRTLASGAIPIALAGRVAQTSTGVTKGVADLLSANRAQQLVSAASAGGAGGYVRETGGNATTQTLASLAAGIAAPAAMNAGQRLAATAARSLTPSPQQGAQIDITINNALQSSGMQLGDLPASIASGIRNDVAAAYKTGGVLSPDGIRRLADYRLTGATPTAASLTLDPGVVSRQKNLAKLGINSKDPVAQQLAQTENSNNNVLIRGLNDLGGSTADDSISGAQKIMSALSTKDDRAQGYIGDLYSQARAEDGRAAPLDHTAFTNRAADLLNGANAESFLTPDIRSKLNDFATNKVPLNVDIAEQFKTNIGRLQRNSTDGNTRYALGLVRQALDQTPLLTPQAGASTAGIGQLAAPGAANIGQDAIKAFNEARSANRSWMQTVENTPALAAVRDGIEPDKFVNKFLVGSGDGASVMSVAQLKNQIKDTPEAMQAVREQITSFLKQKALNGSEDEVGKFSQSAYNNAFKSIGERKLNLFFKPDEVNQLKAIGRVASYEQVQPVGSAVNNSNTAGTAGAMWLDRVASSPLLSKIPVLGSAIQPAAQNIVIGMKAGNAMNVPMNIARPGARASLLGPGMGLSPAALLLQQQDERNR